MLTIKCLVEQYIQEYKNWKSVIYVEQQDVKCGVVTFKV